LCCEKRRDEEAEEVVASMDHVRARAGGEWVEEDAAVVSSNEIGPAISGGCRIGL
jgi:hypothetical protein